MRVKALLLAALLAIGPASAQSINDAYSVSGDAPALPVQAFDDGQWLYVQLRDPMNPPAPFGPHGPIQYQMRGPYLVLPILSDVTLRLGHFQARVTSGGAALGGIVSLTSPVGVNVEPERRSASPAQYSVAPAAAAAPLMADAVSGEIVVDGPSGVSRNAIGTGSSVAGGRAVAATAAAVAATYAGLAQALVLTADGTAAGASAVLAARDVCTKTGRSCTVEYRGAPAGHINVSEKI